MLGGNIMGQTNKMSLEIYNAVFNGEYARAVILSGLLGVASLLVFLLLPAAGGRFSADATPSRR